MNRNIWKWLALGGALTFLVLFGMEMSTSGIERIYGPIEAEAGSTVPDAREIRYASETERRIAELERELADIRKLAYGDERRDDSNPRLPGVPYEYEQAAVNKLADSTSGLLQSASSRGIRFVVSLFDGLIH